MVLSKTDFVNKLISFNRKTTSNKTKYLEAQKYPSSLKKKIIFKRIFSKVEFILQVIMDLETHLFINQQS